MPTGSRCIVSVVMLSRLSAGTMETGRSHATGFTAEKSLLVQTSCSGTNGHTQVHSSVIHCFVPDEVRLSFALSRHYICNGRVA